MLHPAAQQGPPQVWNFSCLAFQGRLPALQSHRLNIPLECLKRWLGRQQAPQGHTSMASYGPLKTFPCHASLNSLNRHLQGHSINGFLWASKPAVCQPLKPLKRLKTLANRLKTLTTRFLWAVLNNPVCMLHPAANRHPKATHQWLLMGVQACRLPALKPLKRLKTLKTLTWHEHPAPTHPEATHQWLLMGRLNNPLACFILQPTGTPRPHINGFLWASKPAVCQPLNPLKPQGHTSKRFKPLKRLPLAMP